MSILLLSIGDELLDGRTANTNATYFGEQLRLSGVQVSEIRCVSDRVEDIVNALKEKFSVVIATGGLGPTNDDRTMEAAAKTFHKKLAPTKASLAHIQKRYAARGMPLTPPRLRMANVPQGAKIIENLTGTAPGVYFRHKKTDFYFLPGPPNECRPMFEKNILPKLKKLAPKKLVHREFWRTFGKGESDVFERIAPFVTEFEKKYPDTFTFGVHISFPCVDLTFEVWSGKKKPSTKEISDLSKKITEAIGTLCFTRERETLPETIFRLLLDKKKTLVTAESCTGGLVSKLITDIPGSSVVFLGAAVTYANSAKEILLNVKRETLEAHGAVSEQTVKEMAESIRKKLGADFALALSGVAGPGGGTPEKPVGTIHVALSSAQETKTIHRVIFFGKGSRDQNRTIAAYLALDALRAELLGFHGNGFPLSSNA